MHSFLHHLLHLIKKNSLIGKETVVLGVSAGPDSICMLYGLSALRRQLKCTLVPVYIDHGIRPDETDTERDLVAAAARELGWEFFSFSVNTMEYKREKRISLEHAARELRYESLRSLALKIGAGRIGIGHTADDQVEEVFFRAIRGSSGKALSGMQLCQGDIVRPLLRTYKKDILAWLSDNSIAFCQDSSNFELDFTRNRIRHKILPFLEKELGTGIKSGLLKTADNMGVDEAFLTEQVDKVWQKVVNFPGPGDEISCSLVRKVFVELHECLQRRVVERLLWQLSSKASHAHIMELIRIAERGKSGDELHLAKGLRVKITRNEMLFSYPMGMVAWRGSVKG